MRAKGFGLRGSAGHGFPLGSGPLANRALAREGKKRVEEVAVPAGAKKGGRGQTGRKCIFPRAA